MILHCDQISSAGISRTFHLRGLKLAGYFKAHVTLRPRGYTNYLQGKITREEYASRISEAKARTGKVEIPYFISTETTD